MRYLSLFSGIEAATVAWTHLNWNAIAFSEIDPFASAVLAHHYPNVPNLGDITKIDWTQYLGKVDLLVGGSPCQDFSISGTKKGLLGDRGRLVFEFLRAVVDCQPKWVIFENVPGFLHDSGGKTFTCFLMLLHALGYNVEYNVLDASDFGLPQRRKRLFLVCRNLEFGLNQRMLGSYLIMSEVLCQLWSDILKLVKTQSKIDLEFLELTTNLHSGVLQNWNSSKVTTLECLTKKWGHIWDVVNTASEVRGKRNCQH